MKITRRRLFLTALLLAASAVVSACQFQLTPDGPPYVMSQSGNNLTITNTDPVQPGCIPPGCSGSDEREVYFSSLLTSESDSTSCAEWGNRADGNPAAQAGIAFHISSGQTIVIEDNIYDDGQWLFPMIYFYGGTFDVGPALDFSGYLGTALGPVIPLYVCAAITSSNQLALAVSKTGDPSSLLWTTSAQSGILTAPSTWGAPTQGYTGVYAAHIPHGTSESFLNVTVDGNPLPDVINH